jgi:predicted nucleotidyltransferase
MGITANEKNALEALRSELSKSFKVKDLRVFGSKVRGTDTEGSDLDVMIVLETLSPEIESQIDDLLFDLNLKYECLIIGLYFGTEEIEKGPLSESPVYKRALLEGMRL